MYKVDNGSKGGGGGTSCAIDTLFGNGRTGAGPISMVGAGSIDGFVRLLPGTKHVLRHGRYVDRPRNATCIRD
jgi:hypothetical protein